jgi:hypothetical protein
MKSNYFIAYLVFWKISRMKFEQNMIMKNHVKFGISRKIWNKQLNKLVDHFKQKNIMLVGRLNALIGLVPMRSWFEFSVNSLYICMGVHIMCLCKYMYGRLAIHVFGTYLNLMMYVYICVCVCVCVCVRHPILPFSSLTTSCAHFHYPTTWTWKSKILFWNMG